MIQMLLAMSELQGKCEASSEWLGWSGAFSSGFLAMKQIARRATSGKAARAAGSARMSLLACDE